MNSLSFAPHELGLILASASSDGSIGIISMNEDSTFQEERVCSQTRMVTIPSIHSTMLLIGLVRPLMDSLYDSTALKFIGKSPVQGCDENKYVFYHIWPTRRRTTRRYKDQQQLPISFNLLSVRLCRLRGHTQLEGRACHGLRQLLQGLWSQPRVRHSLRRGLPPADVTRP